ncbi:MAG: hypothetical protein J0I14_12585 [Propionibacteriaceae bacterium]|jgi:hypothetical protein|nr:hypothetical protein [Propionibacteriaceae bacterium]
MNADPQFEAVEISLEEFERDWMRPKAYPFGERAAEEPWLRRAPAAALRTFPGSAGRLSP